MPANIIIDFVCDEICLSYIQKYLQQKRMPKFVGPFINHNSFSFSIIIASQALKVGGVFQGQIIR